MEKTEFMWILQTALLHFEGKTKTELLELAPNPQLVKAGIQLCNYLKKIELKQEATLKNES